MALCQIDGTKRDLQKELKGLEERWNLLSIEEIFLHREVEGELKWALEHSSSMASKGTLTVLLHGGGLAKIYGTGAVVLQEEPFRHTVEAVAPAARRYLLAEYRRLERLRGAIEALVSRRLALFEVLEDLENEELRIPAALR